MAGDLNKPTGNSLRTAFLQEIRDNVAELAKMSGDFANKMVGVVRRNATTKKFEEWNGSAWVDVDLSGQDVGKVDGCDAGTAANNVLKLDASGYIPTDVITEKSAGTGVTVDGVLLKDSQVTSDMINEKTSGAGVTADGVLLKDSQVKTDVIIEKTGGAGVTVDGVLLKDGGISDGANIIKTKVINIGDWNMDANSLVTVPHGVTQANIRSVSAYIINDAGTYYFPVTPGTNVTNPADAEIQVVAGGQVSLIRKVGGYFDNPNFDSTSYNRGWLIITYVN